MASSDFATKAQAPTETQRLILDKAKVILQEGINRIEIVGRNIALAHGIYVEHDGKNYIVTLDTVNQGCRINEISAKDAETTLALKVNMTPSVSG